jgi:predicted ABC-type ATPase
VYIIAGPNGAGKTTFAREFLPRYAGSTHFVNADLIAEGLSPLLPANAQFRAGRIMLDEISRLGKQSADFGFETTLSGTTHRKVITNLQAAGYSAHLFFLWLPNAELALSRIRGRVESGGHDVPEAVVRRRFNRSLHNLFKYYMPIVNSWMLFDNAGTAPELVAFHNGRSLRIIEPATFAALRKTYQ